MISLASPLWLLALPLPWLSWLAMRSINNSPTKNQPALLHPQAELLAKLSYRLQHKQPPPWLWLLGCSLLLFALTQPQWLDDRSHQGRNFLIAVDVSSSMRAQDFVINNRPVDRLEMVKQIIDPFITSRHGDRIGLLVFGDDAYTLTPMTTDIPLVRQFLAGLSNGMAGDKTALGEAIALGVKRLQQQDAESRVLILLSDGANTAGEIHPLNALQMAQANKIRIYPIGIGSDSQVLFPRGPVEGAQLAELPIDEPLLQKLAADSGGRYYRTEVSADLSAIISAIDELETIEISDSQQRPQPLFVAPLIIGLLLLLTAQWRGQREVVPC